MKSTFRTLSIGTALGLSIGAYIERDSIRQSLRDHYRQQIISQLSSEDRCIYTPDISISYDIHWHWHVVDGKQENCRDIRTLDPLFIF